ncbi:MAG: hypothetical protein ACRYGP_30190 [Janthinobacterium lividum]
MSPVAEQAVAFDPAAFAADMHAIGYGICAYWPVPRGEEKAKPPSYFIQPPEDGFGVEYATVMSRWRGAMNACPDHVVLVVDYVFKCSREAQIALPPDPVRLPS